MNNNKCKTIEEAMQKVKVQSEEREKIAEQVIRGMANETAENILEDADEKAARQFLRIFSQLEEWTSADRWSVSLELIFGILRIFNYGTEADLIATMINTAEREKMFVRMFIECGMEICRSYTE